MKKRKIPLRKSVVSEKQFPKKDLLRIAKNKEGIVTIDPTGKSGGRGAYIALEPDEVALSQKKKILDRALETTLSEAFYQELYDYVVHQKARKELFKEDE